MSVLGGLSPEGAPGNVTAGAQFLILAGTTPFMEDMTSPIPICGAPIDCAELVIYDNDGPEGIYHRLRFERSRDAIFFIMDRFTRNEIALLNFEIINYWDSHEIKASLPDTPAGNGS